VRLGTIVLGLALVPVCGAAQSMRPFSTFRQVHGETRLGAKLEYAAGTLRLAAGSPAELYHLDLSYDEDRYVPVSDYDVRNGTVVLGLTPTGEGGVRVVSRNQLQQVAMLTFSPRIDLALNLALGAVDAEVELGGLRINTLEMSTGASKAVVRFSRPNGARCDRAAISAGAAEVSLLGLGNSRCDRIDFEGGVGKVLLDFSGAWSSSAKVQATMAMGELTLRLPRRIGVRVSMSKFLSSFEPAGLVRRGDDFLSSNYGRTQQHLDLTLTTAVGGVKVEWVD
jgi:hypothetical protein